ncbi:MAG: MmgE/PrpD family protein, partial [Clostridiales bacterium]|nr:MmgE/PrpD family protein [Clostridiales bacterium]
ISIKPYPSCRGTHPTADAALKLARECGVTAENVESIQIRCGKGTRDLLAEPREFKVKPRNFVDGQFSLIWCCATAIVKKQVGLSHFTEESIKDEATLEVASKITVTHDPKYDTGGLEPVRVTARLKDGAEHTVEALTATGSPECPVTFEGCVDKFMGCVEFSTNPMPKATAGKVVETIKNLEEMDDIRALIELLAWQ